MKKRFTIKLKILTATVLILLLVGTVGFLTYRQFNQVLSKLQNSGESDPALKTTKSLIANLSQAEIKVKTYTLTQDSLNLDQYDEYTKKIEHDLQLLKKQMHLTKIKNVPLDSLYDLVHEKLGIFDSLLVLQNEFRVEKALDKVTLSIEDATRTVPVEEEKRRLFSSRKKEKNPTTETIVDYSTVTDKLSAIKKTETLQEEEQLQRELRLLEKDRLFNQEIQAILSKLELAEVNLDKENTLETEVIIRNANLQIVIFCVLISLLLMLMGYTILRYITRSNRYRKVLKRAKNEAESLAKAKEHFVATVSHEIRTPMNIISGFAEQLSGSKLNDQQKDQIQTILKASSHLLKLVNEVLDFTKLQNYKLELEATNFELREVIQEVHDLMLPLAEAKGIDLDLSISDNVPRVVVGDAIRLSQILINIVSNAIKFTPEGVVSLAVIVTDISAESVGIEFSITDTGIGMAPEHIERIFEAFEQAQSSTTRTYGGTGLGLAITKKLIDLHDGEVSVHSKVDVGTEILIDIRYPIGHIGEVASKPHLQLDALDLRSFHILVVDDEPFNRKLLITILNKYKAQITEVTNGREAFEIAKNVKFDLILMDARMPEMDGMTATMHLREEGKNRETPVVALTAAVTEEDQATYRDAHMTSFLAKPYKEQELLKLIIQILHLETHEVSSNGIRKQASSFALDFSELQSISNGDDTFYIEMLETFIHGTKEGILQMKDFASDQLWDRVADVAHKISAPCKHLEALELYETLKEIEVKGRTGENSNELFALVKSVELISKKTLVAVQNELKKQTSH
ncbi:MAG: hypothetical protein A3D92_13760 [Bacteroidetes bacterium RIFCSPHIGHO2_02_FULL_44_7]|nr:MAG: hypothetical protein A3D92_13760 [Bacteroidetes bacterium RIFCSPHIGHO2_02_FULL_44_7]